MRCEFIEEPAAFEMAPDGLVHVSWGGEERIMPLRALRVSASRAVQVIKDYDARCAEVVRLRGAR